MQVDALVVGAGPAGATAAQRLASRGWSVALVEKAPFPRTKVCGEFISAPSLALLEGLGVSDSFLAAAGPPVRRVALFAGDMDVRAPLPASTRPGRALGREYLDTLLRDAAVTAGATLLQPAELLSLDGAPGRITARLRQGDETITLTARLAVIACGSWNRTGPFALTGDSGLLAFKARFHAASLPPDLMPLLAFPGGYGGLVTSSEGRLSLSCCIRRDLLQRVRQEGERAGDAVLRHMGEHIASLRDVLRGSRQEGTTLSVGPIQPGRRARYHNGVFFTGNMAGEAHPIIADGISMAMQSSWLLSDLLAANPIDDAGARYAHAAARAFGLRIAASRLFAALAMHDSSRALAGRMVAALPALLTWGARASGKAAAAGPALANRL